MHETMNDRMDGTPAVQHQRRGASLGRQHGGGGHHRVILLEIKLERHLLRHRRGRGRRVRWREEGRLSRETNNFFETVLV